MKRDIITIDEEKCNGCGLCVPNCHEGALQVIDGKVRLVSEILCDGLGACIGHCPEGAITIETRDAEPYNETMVMEQMALKGQNHQHVHSHSNGHSHSGGCPGSKEMVIERRQNDRPIASAYDQPSELRQWPVQLHLLNPSASYLKDADLLLAADCTAFTMGNFHSGHLKNKALAIACPKLDHSLDTYIQKLTAMIEDARVNTITIMMMEVPCCGGLLQLVKAAQAKTSRKVPVRQVIVGITGEVLKEEWV